MINKLYLFDMDGTLYEKSNPITFELRQKCFSRISQIYSCSLDEASKLYFGLARDYPNPYKGLGSLGITPDEYMKFFNDLSVEKYIKKDQELFQFLNTISGEKRIVTFSPMDYARRVLNSLGVAQCFDEIICMNSVYDYEKKNYYATLHCDNFDSIYVFGDDYINDILPALNKGFNCYYITRKPMKNVKCINKIVDCILS